MSQYKYNIHDIVINIPKAVGRILDQLNQAGYEAFVVGGCVRDVILGRTPEDWDITTSAKPEQVKRLFPRTIDTGIAHGTVTVRMDHAGYEITTYRIDGEYLDNRHPESVEYTSNLTEDLKRRDFTINAMAYNPTYGLVDHFDGISDLENHIIKCVGDPGERFREDALRILRAIRFSAQLGFEIDEETKSAITEFAPNLKVISRERIQVELDKLLLSKEPWKIRLCYETGISRFIMPWFDRMFATEQNTPFHDYNVGDHSIKVLMNIKADHYLRWAALLHDIGKPDVRTTDDKGIDHFYRHEMIGEEKARDILKDLRVDNKTIDIVTRLIRYHCYHPALTMPSVRRSINRIGKDIYPSFIALKEADMKGKSQFAHDKGKDEIRFIKEVYPEIVSANDCLSLKDLAVTGKDLVALGIKPGKEIGDILNQLLDIVLTDPEYNNKEYLLSRIKDL